MGVVAVVLSFMLAIVACRATGETDITPVGAMARSPATYGVLAPSNNDELELTRASRQHRKVRRPTCSMI